MAFAKLNSMKFVGLGGLSHFWSKAKTWIINRITTEVTAKIAEVVAKAPEDLDTLKEIADWISAHANDAAAMNTAISTNTSDIATLKTTVSGKSDTGHKHAAEDITSGKKLLLQGGTVNSNSYTDINPKIEFKNIDGRQKVSLTFTDYDSVQAPASITLNGNQGDEYFIAPNIKATGNFYGNLSGKANTAGTADKTVNDISIYIPYVSESGEYVIPLGNILEPTSTATESPYNWDITGFFSIIRPSGHNGSHIQFEAGHGYSHAWTTYAYLDKMDFKFVTTSIKAFQYNGKWWMGLCISVNHQDYYSKMTITYSRGLPATPTCILYNSDSNGVANEEIYNSIQDIPSSWWRQRTICNPTTFNDKLYVDGLITPRQGTDDGVSIGREDGNITIGNTNNNNTGNTVINNDCKMIHDLEVFGEGNFVGPCFFNDDIFVHSKSLFPSGYIPRTYFIERATKDNITAKQKELLRKMFAYQSVNRLIQCYGLLFYRVNTSEKYFGGRVVTVGYFDGDDWLDSNENISYDDNSCVNYACFGIQEDGENIYFCDMSNISEQVMRNNFESLNYLLVNKLSFTVLEKV